MNEDTSNISVTLDGAPQTLQFFWSLPEGEGVDEASHFDPHGGTGINNAMPGESSLPWNPSPSLAEFDPRWLFYPEPLEPQSQPGTGLNPHSQPPPTPRSKDRKSVV